MVELNGITIGNEAKRSDRVRIALVEGGPVVVQPPRVTAHLDAKAIVIEVDAARARVLANIKQPLVLDAASFAAIRLRLERELLARDEARLAALEGLALEVIAECARTHGRQRDPLAVEAAAIIAQQFSEPLSVASLAQQLDVQPSTLSSRFRRHYGVAIGEYLRNCRIEFARRALLDRELTIADVARQAGFYDQSHFVRVFKRTTGETPIAFRRAAASTRNAADRPGREGRTPPPPPPAEAAAARENRSWSAG